jgi:hypothetical protein
VGQYLFFDRNGGNNFIAKKLQKLLQKDEKE